MNQRILMFFFMTKIKEEVIFVMIEMMIITKGIFFKVYLKDVFGLTEHQKSYLWLELESIDENE